MTERIPVAILGASGYVGQHLVRLLADHPQFEVARMVGGERSDGSLLAKLWRLPEPLPRSVDRVRLAPRTPRQLAREGVRAAFSALPSGRAGPVERKLLGSGISVFTNAADQRDSPDATLMIPEVNPAELRGRGRKGRPVLVANPNCTATGLALALAPVWRLLAPSAVHVATYQALSGAGFAGVSSLASTDNVVPFISGEEEKVERETNRLLAPFRTRSGREGPTPILAQCARVGVRDGHLEAVTVVARGRPTLSELRTAWSEFDPLRGRDLPSAPSPPVIVRDEPDRPQPILDRGAGEPPAAAGMAVVIGRLRWTPPYLRCFVLSHNAIRGAAGGALLNAEFARAEGYLDP
ncbi:MAG TPA: aspartate-semialdehyde dehydrogenase [Thermoplasmata archaeon]|nr:aspartate-semialdehyde dehydrogenase [Thermoplasmata archaeon]